MTKKTKFILGMLFLIIIAVWYFMYRSKRGLSLVPGSSSLSPGTQTVNMFPNNPNAGTDNFSLRLGSKGPRVAKVQQALNTMKGANLIVDGVFGASTEAALVKYYNTVGVDQWNYTNTFKLT